MENKSSADDLNSSAISLIQFAADGDGRFIVIRSSRGTSVLDSTNRHWFNTLTLDIDLM